MEVRRPDVVFGEKELSIFRRTERAMVRAMCGMKLMDRKNTDEFDGYARIK